MAATKKKKADQGAAISNKFTIPPKSKPIMSPSMREVPGTRKPLNDAQKDSVIKSWQSNKFSIPKKAMKSGGKMKKK